MRLRTSRLIELVETNYVDLKEKIVRIVKPGYVILTPIDGEGILKQIEAIARTCYKSEDKITEGSAERMVRNLIKNGHEAMLEHYSISVRFIVDRGVSHELVRHRVASFAQESTRYCNYSQDRFEHHITVIEPNFAEFEKDDWITCREVWEDSCKTAEYAYFKLLEKGVTPQIARSVLPNSLKTEIVMTANLREWRHFFKLRAAGTTGKPHPQMLEVTVPLLNELKSKIPIVFDDIVPIGEV